MEKGVKYIWHPFCHIENLKFHQVYGFCMSMNNKFLLVRDWNEIRFTLPGGRVEEGELPQEAFIREIREEAQVEISNIKFLGSLEVLCTSQNGVILDHHQQAKYFADVEKIDSFIPRFAESEIEERKEVDMNALARYIDWLNYTSGRQIFKSLKE